MLRWQIISKQIEESQYEGTRDAQSFCREVAKHALASTSAWLSVDDLLRYITTACYPDNRCSTAFAFYYTGKNKSKDMKDLSSKHSLSDRSCI
jgi:hypothetical protein